MNTRFNLYTEDGEFRMDSPCREEILFVPRVDPTDFIQFTSGRGDITALVDEVRQWDKNIQVDLCDNIVQVGCNIPLLELHPVLGFLRDGYVHEHTIFEIVKRMPSKMLADLDWYNVTGPMYVLQQLPAHVTYRLLRPLRLEKARDINYMGSVLFAFTLEKHQLDQIKISPKVVDLVEDSGGAYIIVDRLTFGNIFRKASFVPVFHQTTWKTRFGKLYDARFETSMVNEAALALALICAERT